MKTTRIMTVAALIVAGGLALHMALAQPPGIKRTDLQRHDLSVPGREVVQVRVELAPGVSVPKHTHPGEEIIYVLEGFAGISGRGQAAGDAQGRRGLVHPCRSSPLGEERRQRQRGGARHVYRRKREAARCVGQVSALRALLTELRLTTKATARLPNRELYQLIRQPKPIAERQFEIEFLDSDVEAFAFTFG